MFSTRVFRALAAEQPEGVAARLAPLATVDVPGTATLGERFEAAHRSLVASYRSEYVFKNTLVSRIVFGKHRPATAAAIMEMPMGDSEADLLVLNGTSTVYEIKTDLDQFSRLSGQLRDYCTRADRVYVVTSDGRAATAEALVPNHVGILALRRSGALSTVRPATSNLDQIRHEHLFRMLRRNEAQAILRDHIGYTPDVPTGQLSERMGALFGELDVADAHRLVVTQLRQRGRAAASLTRAVGFPRSLRALAYGTELSGVGRERLLRRLHQPMALMLGA
ncbi:sce7726 family protein [Curtobacterium sp. CT11-45]|uniref:sce7726 family protein n=1 Tax=Curtobacterium sp. CT11-45 TaxID=3243037 RepID=UPI0039B0552B